MDLKHKELVIRIVLGIFLLSLLVFIVAPKQEQQVNYSKNTTATEQKLGKITIINIILTPKGFEPQEITIKKNDVIVWTNKSGKRASVNSAEYPTHRLFPVLNLGIFEDGQSVQTRILRSGEFRYVNHYIPQQTGTITVKN